MFTTVKPCVAVNDGVCDFGPKVHLRGVKAHYTQTWWLRPPPFLIKGLLAYSWMPMISMLVSLYTMVLFLCRDIYFARLTIYPLLHSPGLSKFSPKCRTSEVFRTFDASVQRLAQNQRTSVHFPTRRTSESQWTFEKSPVPTT